MTGRQNQSALQGFLDIYGVSVEDLRNTIGRLEISRAALDGLVLGTATSHRRTVRLVLQGLGRLVPRRRLSKAGLRFLLDRKRPSTPDELLKLIDRAAQMKDTATSPAH